MIRFKHTFRVKAPLAAVWKFHEDPIALKQLTPPPIGVKILHMDQPLRAGATLRFRLGVGPIGTVWNAVYDEFQPYQPGEKRCGFVDRALSSPFKSWTHRHTFEDNGDGTSTVTDDAAFEVLGGLPGRVVNPLVARPAVIILFLYRRLQTQRLLARLPR